jgi:hypothetical protein
MNKIKLTYGKHTSDFFTCVLTLSFTHRTTMEGHAIHSESCFHIQQDEEHVPVDNRMW